MKSLLKNSRQSFITQVSYGMKNMVVLPEDSKSRSRGFNKAAKNFSFFKIKIKFAAAKINQTISLSLHNTSYQSSFSIFFVHVVKVPWHIVRSEDKIHEWAVLFQQVGSGLRLGLSNLTTGTLACWAFVLAIILNFAVLLFFKFYIYVWCTLQGQRRLIPETRVTGGCEPYDMGVRNKLRSPRNVDCALSHLATSLVPLNFHHYYNISFLCVWDCMFLCSLVCMHMCVPVHACAEAQSRRWYLSWLRPTLFTEAGCLGWTELPCHLVWPHHMLGIPFQCLPLCLNDFCVSAGDLNSHPHSLTPSHLPSPAFHYEQKRVEVGEMAHWLRTHVDLEEDLGSVLNHAHGGSQPT